MNNREAETRYRYRFGSVEFDESKYELRVDGAAVAIERRPLEILAVLLRHSGEVIPKEELFDALWGGRITVDNVLANAVAKLRLALGKNNAAYIVTKPRIGYLFSGELERTATAQRTHKRFELQPGSAVPKRENFILERQLGHSDNGEVWLSSHRKNGEKRVYKFGLDGEQLRGLRREASLYRVLREGLGPRTDFVSILDWNFEDAPFFLECEYAGDNLLQWAEAANHLQTTALPQRLNLFLNLADAVAAAHSVGVLHKDLKPSNVLLQETATGWQLKVTDFGSGRLLDQELLKELGITQLGLNMTQGIDTDSHSGTLLYLAPELVIGQPPTIQSDVYALGLMLYQMAIGDLRKPMASGWERDIEDELLQQDIALATDGNPQRRLASVSLLVERLRTLEQRRAAHVRTVELESQARQAQLKLQQSLARRPWVIASFIVLATGLTLSTWLYQSARSAQNTAQLEASRAEALNRFLSNDLLGAADPTAPGSVGDPKVRDILSIAARKLDQRLTEQPATRASMYLALGRASLGLSDYTKAEQYLQRAIELFSANVRSDEVLAQAEYELVKVLVSVSKMPEAKALLEQADKDAGARLVTSSRLALQAKMAHGYFYDSQSLQEQALASFTAADKLRQVVAANDDALLFAIRIQLINSYIATRKFDVAEQFCQQLMAPEYSAERVGINNWAKPRLALGEILTHRAQFAAAIVLDKEVVTKTTARLGADHFYTGYALSELASVYFDSGQFEQAVEPTRRVYEIVRRQLGEHSQNAVATRVNLGTLELQSNHFVQAASDLEAARNDFASLFGDNNPQVEVVNFYLATALSGAGKQQQAMHLVNSIHPEKLADSGEGGDGWEERLSALKGQILLRQGNKAQAFALLDPAVKKMQAGGIQAWILDPFKEALAQASH